MARYSFSEDPKGGVGMEVVARDQTEMFNAAASALCLFMWDQDSVEEREEIPIAWYGFDVPTTVVGLLSELLYQMDNGWVIKRFVTHALEEVEAQCERALWIEGGVLRSDGPAADVVAEYAAHVG
jgi:SHS2 domain-containing protein